MNSVNLMGRLTANPELRTTQNGKYVCTFTLAVPRDYGTDGQTDFITCVAWGKTAQIIDKYGSKGEQYGITGQIQSRYYEDKNGKKVYVTEVIVSRFDFCGGVVHKANEKEDEVSVPDVPQQLDDDDLPF